jgi:hypothetical protein
MGKLRYSFTILDLGANGGEWSASRPGRFTQGERAPVHIGYEAGWAQDQVWTLWSTHTYFVPAKNRTPAVQPVVRHYIH